MKGHNFIDGKWVGGATATRDINPSNTADVVGEYAQADRQQALLSGENRVTLTSPSCVRSDGNRARSVQVVVSIRIATAISLHASVRPSGLKSAS